MKERIFKFLFPAEAAQLAFMRDNWLSDQEEIDRLEESCEIWGKKYDTLEKELKEWKEKFTPVDMNRMNIKDFLLEFDKLEDRKGGKLYPKHPLSGLPEDEYRNRLKLTEDLFKNEMLWEYKRYFTNCWGNDILRYTKDQMEDYAARFSINGMSVLCDEIERGHNLFMETVAPPEEFDKFEVGINSEL